MSDCDEHLVNISCGSNAVCRKFEITPISLYF